MPFMINSIKDILTTFVNLVLNLSIKNMLNIKDNTIINDLFDILRKNPQNPEILEDFKRKYLINNLIFHGIKKNTGEFISRLNGDVAIIESGIVTIKSRNANSEVSSVALESVSLIRIISAFGNEKQEYNRYKNKVKLVRKYDIQMRFYMNLLIVANQVYKVFFINEKQNTTNPEGYIPKSSISGEIEFKNVYLSKSTRCIDFK
ncbi:hypothetical protein PIROE2DRAFT_11558 [Piromyces sp. E2]|nr:hypothetical protein PIROE2DRAFT_11558 [Piromyces sp. E2]|eukprot:OUM62239.1 hypothetical protein PIROE2DRAFT_11558 [Piromyces sp. E2]